MKRVSLLLLAALPGLTGCQNDSFAVVSVVMASGSLDGVAQFRVHVGNQAAQEDLYFPKQPSEALHLDTNHPVTFSVQFSTSRGGEATFEVEPLDRSQASLGYGRSSVAISKGNVATVPVVVYAGAVRPERGLDGGTTSDAGESQLVCDPYVPAAACGNSKTCGLLCSAGQPAVGMCYAAGAGKAGDTCASNNDCSAGSQCFTFSAVGCSVMTCLRFCNHSDAACGEANAFCNVPIHCGTTSPDFAACSRPCDPTGSGTVGCATGLSCFVYAGETTDCACAGLGDVGAPCTQNSGCNGEAGCAGCRTGLSCVVPTGSTTSAGNCRPVCSLASPSCPSGTTCRAFSSSTRMLYGFCQ
jgi:hypothetical protein